ncbi:FMN-binding glutamate synthase family protein [Mesonia maritima]|uniref:Glutamate synthase domain-containing protein 2 n=1 Tax=Mesonia maritima TaxID=1793873 RepID=A0ABU1K794_9FLAO|nr:FMN-binding glutamate synthase family protein [Mesonia maritima]MDR6300377.1 glutamate synthase domain-containing protein 2 [Mesonia maritima]
MDSILTFLGAITWWQWILIFVVLVAIKDVFFNKTHTIKHNFPVVGNLRYFLESIGPELRQYIVANNREELPFDRIQRSWVYASAKNANNYEGFGTDRDINETNYIFVNNAMIPYVMPEKHPNRKDPYFLPCAKVMGLANNRKKPYRPASVINVSAMSFGSLSARAIASLNKGVKKASAYHNTGEGGLSPYHQQGGDIIFQIGTAYFGIRDENGNFSMESLKKLVEDNPSIKAIEIKLSQGAKPGKGGVLPGTKVTKEIANIRKIPMGKDAISPPYHTAFNGTQGLIDFIEDIAAETGLPVGIKAAIGKMDQWHELALLIKQQEKGPDFITIDGGEGGTGAAPPSFADHVSLPFAYGFRDLYKVFKNHDLTDKIVFIGSGKLGFPSKAAMAFSMGVDCINVAREAMLSVGCIQAKSCHTNTCPTGVATQSKWLQAGINVTEKAERVNFYFKNFRKEFIEVTHACGYEHPCQFTMDDVDINLSDQDFTKTLAAAYEYHKVEVPFEGIRALQKCKYLGGNYNKKQSESSINKEEVRY